MHMTHGAHPLAGGTDILLWASQRGEPNQLVWTGGVEELHAFEVDGERLKVGAAVPISRMVRSGTFRAAVPAVAEGAQAIGSVQLRNQATLIGNVCTASPAGDTLPGLLVHDAEIEVAAVGGKRRNINLADFIIGPGQTGLQAGELAVAISLSSLGPGEASAFQRFTERRALDLAFAGVAVRLALDSDSCTVRAAHLALGAVGPTAFNAAEAAATLVGQPLSEATLQACAKVAAEICKPITDHRATADYRRQLVKVLVRDVVTEAGRRAQALDLGTKPT